MIGVGCDPEVFLKDKQGNLVSAIGKIGGTKKRPRVIKSLNDKFKYLMPVGMFAVQEDNVALEYNTPVAYEKGVWNEYHRNINNHIDEELDKMGLKRHIVPAEVFPEKELTDPRSWVFGCEPDYSAWELKVNPRPSSDNKFLRSAGGHIHVSYDNPNKVYSIELARLLDAFIGIPMMVVEQPNRRAELYGKPGAMRFKPYGMEYRTPSNFWTEKRSRTEWVFNQVQHATSYLHKPQHILIPEIPKILETRDIAAAKAFMSDKGIDACPL